MFSYSLVDTIIVKWYSGEVSVQDSNMKTI